MIVFEGYNLLECLEDKDSTTDNDIKSCDFTEVYTREDNILTFEIGGMKIVVDLSGGKGVATEFGEDV